MSWPTLQEYNEAVQNPQFNFEEAELRSGQPDLTPLGLPRAITGGFASVYRIKSKNREWAVRCFLREFLDQQERYAAISRHLTGAKLPYTVGFEFLPRGIRVRATWYPILKMEWINGERLDTFIEKNLHSQPILTHLADEWVKMTQTLVQHQIGHGDLQHGNVLVVNGNLKLIDYDGMYVPALAGQISHEVGHRNYQHPRRTETDFGHDLDAFSSWVIYLSILALSIDPTLWKQFKPDESLLFRREDFERPDLSRILSAIEGMTDSRVQVLTAHFRSLLYSPLDQVSPIHAVHVVSTSQTDIAAVPEGQPAEPAIPSGPSWIFDHLAPVSPVSVFDVPPRRVVFGVSAALISVNVSFSLSAALGLISIFSAAFACLLSIGMTVVSLYSQLTKLPRFREKIAINSKLDELERKIADIRSNIREHHTRKNVLDSDEVKGVKQTQEKLRTQARVKADAIAKTDRDLASTLSVMGSKRQSMDKALQNDLAQALQVQQTTYVTQKLSVHSVSQAGLGPTMTARLFSAGIRNAAEFDDCVVRRSYRRETAYIQLLGGHFIHVDGIGPKRASTLLSWRQSVLAQIRSSIPARLPTAQENVIRAKYDSQRKALDTEETRARQEAAQKKSAIEANYRNISKDLERDIEKMRASYATDRAKILEQIANDQRLLSEELWKVGMTKRDLERYAGVTLIAYMKQTLRIAVWR